MNPLSDTPKNGTVRGVVIGALAATTLLVVFAAGVVGVPGMWTGTGTMGGGAMGGAMSGSMASHHAAGGMGGAMGGDMAAMHAQCQAYQGNATA